MLTIGLMLQTSKQTNKTTTNQFLKNKTPKLAQPSLTSLQNGN